MFTSEGFSLPLGSCILGIPIKLHITFFLLLGLELLNAISRYSDPRYTLLIAILYGPILLLTIVVHEVGHAYANKKYGGEAHEIVLWPLGGFVVLGRTEGADVMEDFWVALAGPLTHIPMTAFWFALFVATTQDPSAFSPRSLYFEDLETAKGWFAALFEDAIVMNFVLFVFNLFIPAYPLDGGRCLAALLVKCGTPVPQAAIGTAVTAMVLAVGMIIFGILQLFETGGGGVFMILIGAWIIYISYFLFQMARNGRVHEHPMFNKECYRRARGGVDEGIETTANPVAAAGAASNVNTGGQNAMAPELERVERDAERKAERGSGLGGRLSGMFSKSQKGKGGVQADGDHVV